MRRENGKTGEHRRVVVVSAAGVFGDSGVFFFSSRRRHTRCSRDWSSDVCSSDLMARGERPIPEGVSYDDADAWNAKFAAARKATPVRQVLDDLERSHADFMRAAAAVPAERFQPGKTAWKIVDLNSAHHYKEHGDQIRAWRAAKGR